MNKRNKQIANNQAVLKSLKPNLKPFTAVQLLSLTDPEGRLSTNQRDLERILAHVSNHPEVAEWVGVMSFMLMRKAHTFIEANPPQWLLDMRKRTAKVVEKLGKNNFKGLIAYTQQRNKIYHIPAMAL
jgi:hypothetical protein